MRRLIGFNPWWLLVGLLLCPLADFIFEPPFDSGPTELARFEGAIFCSVYSFFTIIAICTRWRIRALVLIFMAIPFWLYFGAIILSVFMGFAAYKEHISQSTGHIVFAISPLVFPPIIAALITRGAIRSWNRKSKSPTELTKLKPADG